MVNDPRLRRSTRSKRSVAAATSSFLDLDAATSDDDDDLPFSSLLQAVAQAMDDTFINDEVRASVEEQEHGANAVQEPDAEPGPSERRPRRKRPPNASLEECFGSSGSSTED